MTQALSVDYEAIVQYWSMMERATRPFETEEFIALYICQTSAGGWGAYKLRHGPLCCQAVSSAPGEGVGLAIIQYLISTLRGIPPRVITSLVPDSVFFPLPYSNRSVMLRIPRTDYRA